MATVLELVSDALTDIGVLAEGETASAGTGASALRALNRMVNAWQAERVYIYQTTRTEWAIVVGDGSYSVGTGADVNVLRPVHIDAVTIMDTSTTPDTEYPPLRLMTDADYAGIAQKALTAELPEAAWYNKTAANATLELWPVPTGTTLKGVLYAPQAVSTFASLATTVTLPAAYERMIVKNLALELAPSYVTEVNPLLVKQAQDSLAVVLRANKKLVDMQFPGDALVGGPSYDITLG